VVEDEIVRWHHQLNGLELGQALGDSEGQRKKYHMTLLAYGI